MARWAIMLVPPAQNNERDRVLLLTEVEGDREAAEAALWEQVSAYRPRRPVTPRRRSLYRTPEGWMLVLQGAFDRLYPHRFLLLQEYEYPARGE